jgi:hypothetical protein
MVAGRYQLEHLLVHRNELVLRQRLLLLPIDEGLGDLLLEVARLHCVDDLQSVTSCRLR